MVAVRDKYIVKDAELGNGVEPASDFKLGIADGKQKCSCSP